MNNKYIRYILGFFLLALILVALFFSKTILFFVSIFFIFIALNEYRSMFKGNNILIHKYIPELFGITCSFIFSFSNILEKNNYHNYVTPILTFFIITTFFVTIIKNKKPYIYTSLSTISAILFIFCGLYIIKIANFCEINYYSWTLLITYFAIILIGDWTASIFGQKNTKILLAKEISPNKTLFGCFINLFSSVLLSLSLLKIANFNLVECISFGIIASIFSQIGDLTISTFKRDLNLKHSGNFFYEYGGVLDRMDAFIFSAPAIYYLLCLYTKI